MVMDPESMLRVGNMLVPLIFMPDRTDLSTFAGDKKELPVYMTFGNVSSKIRQMHSMHSVAMVALLPIRMKNHTILQKRLDEHQQTYQEVLNEVLRQVA